MSNSSIEELLGVCQDASQSVFEQSSAFEDYFPSEDGLYDMQLGEPVFKTYTAQDGNTYGILDVKLTNLNGPDEGKEWAYALFASNKAHCSTLKNLCAVLSGSEDVPETYNETVKMVVSNAKDRIVTCEVAHKPNKKDPSKPYENLLFKELVS